MTILTEIETKLIDEYFIKHNITDIRYSDFLQANSCLPSWRNEQICNSYDYKTASITIAPAYYEYIEKLFRDNLIV